MAKLSKEDFMSKYKDTLSGYDNIELIEDISDSLSFEESEELQSLRVEIEQAHMELEQAKKDFMDLKEKYKERFFSAIASDEIMTDDEEKEVEEKEVIDIKEI